MLDMTTTVRQPNGTAYNWTLLPSDAYSAFWENEEGDRLSVHYNAYPRFRTPTGHTYRLPVYAEDLEECLEANATFLHEEGLL